MLSNFGIILLILTLILSAVIIYNSFLDLKVSNKLIKRTIYRLNWSINYRFSKDVWDTIPSS